MNPSPLTVLIVEDDDFISTYLEDKLRDTFQTIVVTNAKQARETLEATPISLIVLDIMLPEEDGFSFLSDIKQKDSPHYRIPVIILSNLGQPEHVDRGLALGAQEYLVKANYTPDQIAERIKAILHIS